MSEWKKAKRIESGNFPKSSFVGVLKAIYPKYNDSLGAYVLQLDFEDGKTYNLQCIVESDKAKTEDGIYGLHEDGTYDSFLSVGQLIDSIEKIDVTTGLPATSKEAQTVQCFWSYMGDEIAGFKTEPDCIGHTIHNIAVPKVIGDDQQTSKYPDWIWGQVEGLNKPQQPTAKNKPGKLPPEPKIVDNPKPTPKSDISAQILTALEAQPMSYGELYLHFGKKHKISEIREAIADLGEAVTEKNKKWEVAQ